MDPAEVTTFIDDLHTAVQENPEAARQKVADLKAKIQTLSPEDQAQIREGIEELRSRAQEPSTGAAGPTARHRRDDPRLAAPSSSNQKSAPPLISVRGGARFVSS
jgi:ElaB/YqjD/DUF883 family membrane-anchored ribosome-binding protein